MSHIELKKYLIPYIESLGIETDRSRKPVCPICGSGNGKSGTSAFSIYEDGEKWKCHKCDKGGDIVDLVEAVEGITHTEALAMLQERFLGHSREVYTPKASKTPPKPVQAVKMPLNRYYVQTKAEEYMNARGISKDTALAFGLFYDNGRVMIPTGEDSYVGRAIDDKLEPRVKAFGKRCLFNGKVLNDGGIVYVVEGEIDALSLIEVGVNAVGLGGTSGCKSLVEAVKASPNAPMLILALDNDDAGRTAQGELVEMLRDNAYSRFKALESVDGVHPLYSEYKDANEALKASRKALEERTSTAILIEPLGMRLKRIAEKMKESAKVIPVTLNALADALPRGGFTKGLYVLGASPAMGKSALCQQIADDVARNGHKVLYLSFEMGEDELLLRSMIRSNAERGNESLNAKEAENHFLNGITDFLPQGLNNMFVEDFTDNMPTLETVKEVFDKFMMLKHDKMPLVIVDYLQMVQLTDKRENADTVTRLQTVALELRKMSRLCPFLVISSLNREGRKEDTPKLESFLGSGSIEYSANWAGILWLTPLPQDEAPPKGKKAITLHCVKVRSGLAKSKHLYFVGSEYRFEGVDEILMKAEYKTVKPKQKKPQIWKK